MKKLIWQLIANTISKHPKLVDAIIKQAQKRPYFHLDGYMSRWWLMPSWALHQDEHGHQFPKPWVPFSIRVHYIRRADSGRDLHDHPFDYRTIIMRGSYEEMDIFGNVTLRPAGYTNVSRAQTFHRINWVPKHGVWTLFIMGKRQNRWGFLVGGKKIYYRDYLGESSTE